MDGVLVDSIDVMRQAFEIAYAEVVGGTTPLFDEYRKHLGRYFPDIMRIMGLPGEMQAPYMRESARLADQVLVYPGIPAMLDQLREMGVATAVATGKSGERARSLLDRLGLLDRFDIVVGSDEVARPKPAPDIVERALDVLGATAVSAAMVGDAITDMRSAQAAGVLAVAAVWGEGDEAELLGVNPDVVLRFPAEVPMLVRSHATRGIA
ncbi:phosphoglycolate phosphatase [Actinosynnema sp. ALI-1.44]|nr:phosphoglycolate phosphatase [Actinosynnema sp. ALI-1.44]